VRLAPSNEKLKIEIGFEKPYLLADSRLRDTERLGGARYAETGTRDGAKCLQLLKIHCHASHRWIFSTL